MALQFTYIEPKTGEIQQNLQTQEAAIKTVQHSYLEMLLGDCLNQPNTRLYVAKCYEGASGADLTHLKSKGIYLILGNGRTAYFADAKTAQYIRNVPEFESEIEPLFSDTFSDAIAYGSLPVSEAKASVVGKGRVLVIDDERVDEDGNYAPSWGTKIITLPDGTAANSKLLIEAANALGDSYALISKQQHHQLNQVELWEGLEKQVELNQLAIARKSVLATRFDLSQLASEQSFETPNDPSRVVIELLEDQIQDTLGLSLTSTQYQPGKNVDTVLKWTAQTEAGEVIEGKGTLSAQQDGKVEFVAVGGALSQQQQVKRALQSILNADQISTPFQFRAGTPQWAGIVKGDCRSSDLCEQLGVDAIIPKSAIKGDGKTVELGIHEVDSLFWSKKTEAKINQQRLGAQVLVNFPKGTEHDIEPKIKQRINELVEAQSDPRKVAKLYIKKVERGLASEAEYGNEADERGEESREDWLYTLLKADVSPPSIVVGFNPTDEWAAILSSSTYAALIQTAEARLTVEAFVEQANQLLEQEEILHNDKPGTYTRFSVEGIREGDISILDIEGNAELLEHPKVVEKLEEFLQGEWRDAALGGVEVLSAVAQPHRGLKRGEVCFSEMPHGARVAVYRSPVANSANFRTMINNTADIREQDREAFYQQGVVYLHPEDAEELLIDFDGDAPAIISEEQFVQRVEPKRLESLKSNEICIPTLPNGQKVTLYHSDRQQNTFINNTTVVPEDAGKKQIYLNPGTLKGMKLKSPMSYGYTTEDGLVGFKALLNEIDELNLPENQPVKVEKEKKIVRDANHPSIAKLSPEEQAMAAKFTSIEAAFIDASNNPTGEVANVGMRLEAVRQELLNSPIDQQLELVRNISFELTKRFATQAGSKGAQPGININHTDGKTIAGVNGLTSSISIPPATAQYDFRVGVEHAVNASKYITSKDAQIREQQIKDQVHKLNQLLFQAQGLVATQLQRAVDTPKSARTVDKSVMEFAKALCYKRVEWVAHKKDKDLYTTRKATQEDVKAGLVKPNQEWIAVTLLNNTTDPVGKLVEQANLGFQGTHLEKQELQAFRNLLDYEYTPEQAEIVQAVVGQYNQTIHVASELEKKAEIDQGPRLTLTSQSGNSMEITNLTVFDPKGTSPIWDAIRKQEPIDIKVVNNDKDLIDKLPQESKAFFTRKTHAYAVQATLADGLTHVIGTLAKESQLDLAYRKLTVDAKTDPKARQIKQDVDKSRQALKYQNGQDKDAQARSNIEQKLSGQDITNRNFKQLAPTLSPTFGKEEAKEVRSQAVKTTQEWAQQVHPSHVPAIATVLSHKQGQKLALTLFPEFIAEHLQSNHMITAKLNGLQYETNQCDQMRWDGEQTYPIRVAVDLIPSPKNQTVNEQAVMQVKLGEEWKTLAPLNKESYIPPIGMSGVARIQEAFLQVETPYRTFSIDASEHGIVNASNVDIQFCYSSTKERVFAWTTGESPQCIGELSQKDVGFLKAKEEKEGIQIINGSRFVRAEIAPKTAVVEIESRSVVLPKQWTKRKDLQLNIPLEQVQERLAPKIVPQHPQNCSQSFDPAIPPNPLPSFAVKAKTPQSEAKQEAVQPQTQTAQSPDLKVLSQQYQKAHQEVITLYQAMGHIPTPEQIDAAIALKIYQSIPQHSWIQELRILGQSPQTQQIKAEKGDIAAVAYVQEIMDIAHKQLNFAQQAQKQSGCQR